MRKFFLLSFCMSCVCGISACTSHSQNNQEDIYIVNQEPETIDATTNARNRCGVNGISCNDSALVNYMKTEADFREYGERTKRSHLYTQAGAGNILTAVVRPAVEEYIVVASNAPVAGYDVAENSTVSYNIIPTPPASTVGAFQNENIAEDDDHDIIKDNDGIFKKTSTEEAGARPTNYQTAGKPQGVLHQKKTVTKQDTTEPVQTGDLQIVCETNCEELMNDDVITSEFTEDAFDIANYVSDDDIQFTEIGDKEIITDVAINEVQISDSTVLTWEAEEGDNLKELLSKWSALAGWKLLWQTNRNYVLSAGVMFKGNFADVSSALIRAFARARPAPVATYYKGNRVIVVETMENENAY